MEPSLDSLLEDVIGFPSVTRHCLLHAVHVLAPNGIHTVLPAGGSHKIESFCNQITKLVPVRRQQKQRTLVLPEPPLIASIDIHKFYSGATSVADFTMLLERKLLDTEEVVETEALQRLCWDYYQIEKRSEITYPKWLSEECTYRLWLIYNCALERDLRIYLSKTTMDDTLKRLLHLCGYVWDESYKYTRQEELDFPDYLEAVTDTFGKLGLETSLTCEVILDMVDEIVNGVLKKGYLTKKGHKRKNYKRRWFILQRTILRYYESREKLILKGELVLNGRTEVRGVPDKGTRKYRLHVTCGHSGKEFLICADDQRMKHEWILAIKKAIALAKLLEGESESRLNDLSQSMSGFYLLKYGTTDPQLQRQDSEIHDMKYHTTPRRFQQLTIIGEKKAKMATIIDREGDSDEPKEEYVEMQPGARPRSTSDSEESDVDSEGYLKMTPDRTRLTGSVDEYHSWSASESLSSSIASDASFGQTPTSPVFDKFALPGSPIPEIMESPLESEAVKSLEGSQESLVYDRCDTFTPRYVPARELNTYVGLITRNSTTDSGRGSMSTDSPQPEEDSEVARITEKPQDTDSLDKSSTPKYLTLLRSEEGLLRSEKGEGPPVPPRRSGSRSPVLERRHEISKPPPIRPRATTAKGVKMRHDEPPPPPPRLFTHISSPMLKLTEMRSLPPPVPSRSIRASSPPDYTQSIRLRREVPQEPTLKRRSASSSMLDDDNLIPPPLPPR